MQAAGRLAGSALMPLRAVPVSAALASNYRAAAAVYEAGTIEPIRSTVAMNFLMDQSAENWAQMLGHMRRQLGTCTTVAPIVPNGALAGNFEWQCERGRMQGQVLLAPTSPPTIQALRFRPVPNQAAQ
jgi:hypothetical protein